MRGTMAASSPGLGRGATVAFRIPLHASVEAAQGFDAEVARITSLTDHSGRSRNAAGGRTYERYSSINGGEVRGASAAASRLASPCSRVRQLKGPPPPHAQIGMPVRVPSVQEELSRLRWANRWQAAQPDDQPQGSRRESFAAGGGASPLATPSTTHQGRRRGRADRQGSGLSSGGGSADEASRGSARSQRTSTWWFRFHNSFSGSEPGAQASFRASSMNSRLGERAVQRSLWPTRSNAGGAQAGAGPWAAEGGGSAVAGLAGAGPSLLGGGGSAGPASAAGGPPQLTWLPTIRSEGSRSQQGYSRDGTGGCSNAPLSPQSSLQASASLRASLSLGGASSPGDPAHPALHVQTSFGGGASGHGAARPSPFDAISEKSRSGGGGSARGAAPSPPSAGAGGGGGVFRLSSGGLGRGGSDRRHRNSSSQAEGARDRPRRVFRTITSGIPADIPSDIAEVEVVVEAPAKAGRDKGAAAEAAPAGGAAEAPAPPAQQPPPASEQQQQQHSAPSELPGGRRVHADVPPHQRGAFGTFTEAVAAAGLSMPKDVWPEGVERALPRRSARSSGGGPGGSVTVPPQPHPGPAAAALPAGAPGRILARTPCPCPVSPLPSRRDPHPYMSLTEQLSRLPANST